MMLLLLLTRRGLFGGLAILDLIVFGVFYILFWRCPHCGKVVDGVIEAKGETFKSAQHGFARLLEHSYVDSNADTLVLELCADEISGKQGKELLNP